MKHHASLILFDLDGTLADTAPDMVHALNILTQRHNLPEVSYQRARNTVSKGSIALIHCAFGNDIEENVLKNLQQEYLDIYAQNICINTALFPGINEALHLIEENNLLWGIVTNKPAWLAEPLLKKLELQHRAACIIGGDTLSKRKPHPDQLLHACALLNKKPKNCIYIGDDERDAQAAIAANMPVIIARYGYIDDQETPESWGATDFIEAPTDLKNWLSAQLIA